MKQILLMIAVVMLVGQSVLAADKKPLTKEESAKVIGAAIRSSSYLTGINKPTGELTKADYEKVKSVVLSGLKLTSVKGLEKLTKLDRCFSMTIN